MQYLVRHSRTKDFITKDLIEALEYAISVGKGAVVWEQQNKEQGYTLFLRCGGGTVFTRGTEVYSYVR